MKNLDLYSKIEPLIGFYDEYEKLYELYLKELSNYDVKTILDVGCGNGTLLCYLQVRFCAKGIDLSSHMVGVSKAKGVDAACKNISEVDEKFDAVLAVSDVLNYLDTSELRSFLKNVERVLNTGGIFICDVNTLFGFKEVTAGCMSVDTDEKFLSIEADFNDDVLVTFITLFEKQEKLYTKESAEILQYHHEVDKIKSLTNLTLLNLKEITLFSDLADKNLLIFKKDS
jgi:SAM-dependent methyltransferase